LTRVRAERSGPRHAPVFRIGPEGPARPVVVLGEVVQAAARSGLRRGTARRLPGLPPRHSPVRSRRTTRHRIAPHTATTRVTSEAATGPVPAATEGHPEG
jgi:hypothetical protein